MNPLCSRRSKLKIVYLGTAAIGIPLLRRCDSLWEVTGIITAPDRPMGRGKRLKPTPVKEAGLELGIEVYQPSDVNSHESIQWCRERNPEAFVLFAYGQILTNTLLGIPRWALNVHPSLLPRYRGAAPIQRAIMAGENETGISIIQMEPRVDAGGILAQEPLPIDPEDTYGDLAEHVSRAAPYLVEKALTGLKDRSLIPRPQPEQGITSAPRIRKEERIITWEEPVTSIHNRIRALSPTPLAYTWFRHKRLEIVRSQIADLEGSGKPGTLVSESGMLMVQCGVGFLEVLILKPEGKKEMDSQAFVNGYRPSENDILGYKH
ncbi:methionyl-tRNA formyltransferase [candidate division WOR-3 bacterium]|uniref:Methionyl-tRNA formyltransferase n=1 Tax=candidate division WOR-3 bacterium TaxID=2052148 RepID=A0A9D5KAG6_UNCW3|nr:methionyl-tRNA formyltransferase [candidate division WOR-3 bacterium]MBD3365371.1 methionyl-tRNA formyltransferase [candidate division WOR-3 bacterium]